MAWPRSAKIAFIGSHSVRKSNAVHAFASTIGRAGRSVEVGREVIRDNPLGLNEGASPEAQLWVLMAQVQQELELAKRADVLVTDRSVVDNFAYYLRVTRGEDPFAVEPLIRRWAVTYDLSVRLLPDVGLLADGVRSTSDAFRDEIEAILDRILPIYLPQDRCVSVAARRSQGCRPSGRSGTAAFIRRHSSRISTSVSTSTPNDLCSWYSWNLAPRSLTYQTMAKPTVSSPTTRTATSQ